MSLTSTTRYTAVAAALVSGSLAGVTTAQADESTDQLLDRIDALDAELQAMKAEAKAQESEGDAISRVLDDAEKRSSGIHAMQTSPLMAGHDGKFVLRGEGDNGSFELNPNFQLQIRNVSNFYPENGDAFEDFENGWEIRRAKVGFKGHAFSEDLKYDLKFAFNRSGGAAVLENAFLEYAPEQGLFGSEGVGLVIGQWKDATSYEESVSSSRQMAAERSLANEELGGGFTDYVQGVGLTFEPNEGKWKAMVAYVDGPGSGNTNFTDDSAGGTAAGFSGRVDFILQGDDWKMFEDFTAMGNEAGGLRAGAGAFVSFGELGTEDTTSLVASADVQWENAEGLAFFAAAYVNYLDLGPADATNFGLEGQVSQTFGNDNNWEGFGRYSVVIADTDVVRGTEAEDMFHEVTVGVNRYFEGHKVKATVDLNWLLNGNAGSNSGLGYREQTDDFEAQVAIRGQIQLLL